MSRATSSVRNRFLGLPSTSLGRVSATLFLVTVAFITVASTLFESVGPTLGSMNVLPAIGAALMLVVLITGAVALARDRERSWAVWLSTVLPAVILGAEAISMLIGE